MCFQNEHKKIIFYFCMHVLTKIYLILVTKYTKLKKKKKTSFGQNCWLWWKWHYNCLSQSSTDQLALLAQTKGFPGLQSQGLHTTVYFPTETSCSKPKENVEAETSFLFIYSCDGEWMGSHAQIETNCQFDGRRHTGCSE